MSTEQAAPGWYPDPSGGGERWWDGNAWTDYTRAKPSGTQATVPAGTAVESGSRNWGAIAHASALVGLVIGLSALGPLVVYLLRKDDDPWVRAQAAEALNFNISWLIWGAGLALVTFILVFVLIGILLLPVLIAGVIAWLVLVILAAVKASRGESYRYPLTIRFVN